MKAAKKATDAGKIVRKTSKKSSRPPQKTQSRTEEMQDLFQSDMSQRRQNKKSSGVGNKKSKNSFKSKSRYEAPYLVINPPFDFDLYLTVLLSIFVLYIDFML